jgi:hypothetical protein
LKERGREKKKEFKEYEEYEEYEQYKEEPESRIQEQGARSQEMLGHAEAVSRATPVPAHRC